MTSDRRQDASPAGPTGPWLDDGPTRRFLAACWIWGLASLGLAALAGWSLLHPELADGRPALGFGRLRPLAEMLLLLGFLGNGFFALVHHSTQRLCCAPMAAAPWSPGSSPRPRARWTSPSRACGLSSASSYS